MIFRDNNSFVLNTNNTSYIFEAVESGQLMHLYYGKRIHPDFEALCDKTVFPVGNSTSYGKGASSLALENSYLEFSALGKGDIREPFIEIVHNDGCSTCDFVFETAVISKGKEEGTILPGSYDEDGIVDHLKVTLKDRYYEEYVELDYYVYEKCDVITRSAKYINKSESSVKLLRLMSAQLDFSGSDYAITTFNGAWTREMSKTTTAINSGKYINSSFTGTSSNRANPFVMLHKNNCVENYGECYAFNLIYSGNHYECAEFGPYLKNRFITGINPQNFSFVINSGETFESPEAVLTFSDSGFNGMSHNMHDFVRNHIVRGQWKYKERPILLNSWEASYFDISERKLCKLAKAAKEVGIELFVMDDGWFGNRDDDTKGLGDWKENLKKLPGGIAGLARKINSLGLDFGIWVEPEMVNVNSNLYRNHPEWVIDIDGHEHSEGRNQRILDFTNDEVCDYIIEEMKNVFSSGNISYVKWDMNRIFSDVYSKALAVDRQGEVLHRYVCGLYKVMRALVEEFPNILFEGCASGGNRFDLGILCYFPQIWASDNTDALCRSEIQAGYSYGYPLSTISAHVSGCPNHQTLRITPIETRFNIAAFGCLGYEFNIPDLSDLDKEAITGQIAIYKKIRRTMQFGDFYRDEARENKVSWTCVDRDKAHAVGMVFIPRNVSNGPSVYYKAMGLLDNERYHFANIPAKVNVKVFGDLVNMMSPVHIKQDSIMQDIVSKFVKMESEKDDVILFGDTLNNAGYLLKQNFSGTGFENGMRLFRDFSSQLYFMDIVEKEQD